MIENVKYIVVPDVHGRDFYENDLNTFIESSDAHMVFLGDYLDPYQHEGVSETTALEKFKNIIKAKKEHPDRITLLIGNHDLHYFDGSDRGCRMSHFHYDEINRLFIKNMDLFEFAKFVTIKNDDKDVNIIFSHAGFGFPWIFKYAHKLGIFDCDEFDEDDIKDYFTFDSLSKFDWTEMSRDKNWLIRYGDVGSSRGGWCEHPSFLWADVHDHLFDKNKIKDCIQIFGHTMQLTNTPIRFDNYYCLDCQQVFYINNKGEVFYNDGSLVEDNGEDYKKAYIEYLKKRMAFFI